MSDTSYQDPSTPVDTATAEELRKQRQLVVGLVIGVVVVLALTITALVFLLSPGLTSAETVARIRDVFIIVMAFESLLIGAVLVILIVQLARLTNLLQNEIKPILDSTNQTVSTLRGTSQFISDNLAEPVIKINEYAAALQKLGDLVKFGRKK